MENVLWRDRRKEDGENAVDVIEIMHIKEVPDTSLLYVGEENSIYVQEDENNNIEDVTISKHKDVAESSSDSIHSNMDLDDEEMETTHIQDDDKNHENQIVIESKDDKGDGINNNEPTEDILSRISRRAGLRDI